MTDSTEPMTVANLIELLQEHAQPEWVVKIIDAELDDYPLGVIGYDRKNKEVRLG